MSTSIIRSKTGKTCWKIPSLCKTLVVGNGVRHSKFWTNYDQQRKLIEISNKEDSMRLGHLLKQMLLVCVCLFALTGQAIADSLSDAKRVYDAGDYAKAATLFRPLAEQGDASAQLELGVMYDNGEGVLQDDKEAVKWFRLAADQGNADAQFNLGVMYDRGEGVHQSYKGAVKWFRLAADQGNADAQFYLGVMYDNGQGVPRDYKESVKWYQLAARQGNAYAQFNLGMMYDNGRGVPQDYTEAVKWFRLAAEQGDAKAQANLGAKYDKGQGVSQDYALAYMWANIASAKAPASELQQIVSYRDSIAKKMAAQQIAEAEELARKCTAKKFKGC